MKNKSILNMNNHLISEIDFDLIYYDAHWHPLSKNIIPDYLQLKIDKIFNKLLEYYPDRIIEGLRKKHEKFVESIPDVRRKCGYGDNNELFFNDFGFIYNDKRSGQILSIMNEQIESFMKSHPKLLKTLDSLDSTFIMDFEKSNSLFFSKKERDEIKEELDKSSYHITIDDLFEYINRRIVAKSIDYPDININKIIKGIETIGLEEKVNSCFYFDNENVIINKDVSVLKKNSLADLTINTLKFEDGSIFRKFDSNSVVNCKINCIDFSNVKADEESSIITIEEKAFENSGFNEVKTNTNQLLLDCKSSSFDLKNLLIGGQFSNILEQIYILSSAMVKKENNVVYIYDYYQYKDNSAVGELKRFSTEKYLNIGDIVTIDESGLSYIITSSNYLGKYFKSKHFGYLSDEIVYVSNDINCALEKFKSGKPQNLQFAKDEYYTTVKSIKKQKSYIKNYSRGVNLKVDNFIKSTRPEYIPSNPDKYSLIDAIVGLNNKVNPIMFKKHFNNKCFIKTYLELYTSIYDYDIENISCNELISIFSKIEEDLLKDKDFVFALFDFFGNKSPASLFDLLLEKDKKLVMEFINNQMDEENKERYLTIYRRRGII